jgi:ubiquinone/menaquinone biosynthesis C-methylase UbiE
MSDDAELNPWLKVPASDYEGHMSSPEVGQQQFLSRIFGEMLQEYKPKNLAVIGCATGNGFEHLDPDRIERVIGIDINPGFLDLIRTRFGKRLLQLELICSDVLAYRLASSSLDFIFAGLIFEYLETDAALNRVSEWLKPRGILAVILQLPCDRGKATATQYASLNCLEPVMHLVNPDHLTKLAELHHLNLQTSRTEILVSGKQFFIGAYQREAS